jgi:hypothetical protein
MVLGSRKKKVIKALLREGSSSQLGLQGQQFSQKERLE